jgi:hypothetical protein
VLVAGERVALDVAEVAVVVAIAGERPVGLVMAFGNGR